MNRVLHGRTSVHTRVGSDLVFRHFSEKWRTLAISPLIIDLDFSLSYAASMEETEGHIP